MPRKRVSGKRTKERILRAATKLFGKRGFTETTMEMIAKEARIGKSTIFYYFKSKEGILGKIMEQSVIEVHNNLIKIVNSNANPKEKLKKAITNHIHYLTKYIDNVKIFLSEFKHLSPKRRKAYIEGRKAYEALFETIVKGLQEEGYFKGLNPRVVTFGILGMCNWLIVWYKSGKSGYLSPQEIADHFYRVLLEERRVPSVLRAH